MKCILAAMHPQTQPITIPVSTATAKAFDAATGPERLVASRLLESFFARTKPMRLSTFRKIADAAHNEAVANGLTEELVARHPL